MISFDDRWNGNAKRRTRTHKNRTLRFSFVFDHFPKQVVTEQGANYTKETKRLDWTAGSFLNKYSTAFVLNLPVGVARKHAGVILFNASKKHGWHFSSFTNMNLRR